MTGLISVSIGFPRLSLMVDTARTSALHRISQAELTRLCLVLVVMDSHVAIRPLSTESRGSIGLCRRWG